MGRAMRILNQITRTWAPPFPPLIKLVFGHELPCSLAHGCHARACRSPLSRQSHGPGLPRGAPRRSSVCGGTCGPLGGALGRPDELQRPAKAWIDQHLTLCVSWAQIGQINRVPGTWAPQWERVEVGDAGMTRQSACPHAYTSTSLVPPSHDVAPASAARSQAAASAPACSRVLTQRSLHH
jgi:hypothetical protein